jgi:hypothetical protein
MVATTVATSWRLVARPVATPPDHDRAAVDLSEGRQVDDRPSS